MKRDWELQELIEEWTLVPRELERLGNKTGSTRLGYAALLKFFSARDDFRSLEEISPKQTCGICHGRSMLNQKSFDTMTGRVAVQLTTVARFESFVGSAVLQARMFVTSKTGYFRLSCPNRKISPLWNKQPINVYAS